MYLQLKVMHQIVTKNIVRESSDEGPFAALAFKVMTDPYVGKLTFFRVYSGTLSCWIICSKLN